MYLSEQIKNKWRPIIEHEDLPKIKDSYKRTVTSILLENQERALNEQRGHFLSEANPTSITSPGIHGEGGKMDKFDPVLISLVRRAMPQLIAYDICGVQPMTGPTGLIFAMRARYNNQGGTEALHGEADVSHSSSLAAADSSSTVPGDSTTAVNRGFGTGTFDPTAAGSANDRANTGLEGALTAEMEDVQSPEAFQEMSFSIEKVAVEAKSRALKGEYSMELAQDLKAIHGLDAEAELANILSTEIMAEINREVVRSIYIAAQVGAQPGNQATTGVGGGAISPHVPGTIDLSVLADNGGARWAAEKWKTLLYQIERECNQIARDTRRGKGNLLICSSDVASALQMAGVLDYAPAVQANLNVDDTTNTFVGILNGHIKVYIDPYFESVTGGPENFFVVGYKGSSAYDAGIFYCPYVPLQMVRAMGEDNFQPRIGFKTRYGLVSNPFSVNENQLIGTNKTALGRGEEGLGNGTNLYYRKVRVTNII